MNGVRLNQQQLLCCLIAGLLLLFTSSPGMAVPPKGEVVFATSTGFFSQVGGDPATGSSGQLFLARVVFDSLVFSDKIQNLHPGLAKSWKIAPNWKYIDFFLREDVTFHNGDKFTAEDVKFSLETYLRKELKFVLARQWARNITKIEILGPYQVRLHLKDPDPGFLGGLWWGGGMMPKKYREQVGDKGFAEKPVGTGPYKWVEYKQDNYWKVEAVKKHFRHTPAIKTLKMIYVPDHATRLAMLKAGELDLTDVIPPHTVEVKSDPGLRLIINKNGTLSCLTFADLRTPQEPSPFLDIRVREAASLALDREGITKKVLFGMAEPYGDFCSPITKGHDPTIKPDSYDPQKAKKLLAEAGYPKGFETLISTEQRDRYWIEAIAFNLGEVGIKTKIDVMERATWQEKVLARKFRGLFQQSLWYAASKSAASNASTFFLSQNPFAYYSTPEIEKAVMDGMSAMGDAEETASGKRISKVIRESRIKILLWANYLPFASGPRIEYWEPTAGVLTASGFEFIRLKKQYQ